MQVHLEEAAENRAPSIQDEQIRCPKCKYSLKGLPARGHCPECGGEFRVVLADPVSVARAFSDSVPSWMRLGLRLQPGCLWRWRSPFPAFVVAALFISVMFALAQMVVAVGTFEVMMARSQEQRVWRSAGSALFNTHYNFHNSVLPRRGIWGTRLRVSEEWLFIIVILAFMGQVILGVAIMAAYRRRLRHSNIIGRLRSQIGWCAALSVPALIWLPMLVIALWQGLNVAFPSNRGFVYLGLRWLFDPFDRFESDWVHYVSAGVLFMACLSVALSVVHTHGRCLRRLGVLISGVESIDDRTRFGSPDPVDLRNAIEPAKT